MGSWGPGIFENDDADDWVYQLVRRNNLKLVQDTLSEVRNLEESYLGVSICFESLAAAEVVAALRGYPGQALPDDLAAWIETNSQQVSDELVEKAMMVVVRVLRNSELRTLKENMGYVPMEWYRVIGDLMARLR